MTLRSDWYQNEQTVIVSFFVKGLRAEQVAVAFTDHTVTVRIDSENGPHDRILRLSNAIIPEKSQYSIGAMKMELQLAKAHSHVAWATLEQTDSPLTSSDTSLKYPTSSRRPADAANIDADVDLAPTGEAAVTALFQKIYADASDDTRRAMAKSFVESKGTVLSTNWSEVGTAAVKPAPPRSQ